MKITTFDTSRIVTAMIQRQTRCPVVAAQKRQGRGRRRYKDLPANRHQETGAQVESRNGRPKPR